MTDPIPLEHLRDEIAKLQGIAAAEGLTTLAYLLQMALLEAKAAAHLRRRQK